MNSNDSTPTTTLFLKVFFMRDGSCRKMEIDASTTFDQLLNQVQVSKESNDSRITYQDEEGDWITFSSEEEWRNALDVYMETSPQEPLKINVHQPFAVKKEAAAVLNTLLQKMNSIISDVQKELDNDELKETATKLVNDAKRDLNRAWNEVVQNVINMTTQRPRPSELIEVEIPCDTEQEEISTPIIPQPLPQLPEPVPEPEPAQKQPVVDGESKVEALIISEQMHETNDSENQIVMDEQPKPQIPSNFKYRTELETMFEMGFTDIDTQVKLLTKYRGNIQKAIAAMFK